MSNLKIKLRKCDTKNNKSRVHFDFVSHRYIIANESHVSDDNRIGMFRNTSWLLLK